MAKNKLVQTSIDRVKLITERWLSALKGNNSAWKYRDYDKIAMMETGYDNSKSQNIKGNNDRANTLNVNLYDIGLKTQLSLLNDNPNTILAYAKKPGMELDATIYQQLIRHDMDRNFWDLLKRDLQFNMMTKGTAIAKLKFNEKDKQTEIIAVDPNSVVCASVCKNQHYHLPYIIEINSYSAQFILDTWGVDVSGEGNIDNDDGSNITNFNASEQDSMKRFHNIYEQWEFCDDEKKYPNKWRYEVCTDRTPIKDKSSEWSCGNPYIFGPCYKTSKSIFGIPYIHPLIPVVTELNTMWRRLSKIIEKTVNPQRVVDTSCINPQELNNESGVSYLHKHPTKLPAQAIYELQPAQIPAYYRDMIAQLMDAYQKLSGVQSITLGQADLTSGTPSGKSLEELRMGAQTPARDIARNWKEFETELGTKLTSIQHQKYDEEKIIRITGSDAKTIKEVMNRQYTDVLKQLMEAGADTKEKIKTGVDIYFKKDRALSLKNEKGTSYMSFIGNRLGDPNDFDIDVKSGQDTPRSKIDMAQVAQGLYSNGMGPMDFATYLEVIDFPMKEKVLEKSQKWQAYLQWEMQQAELAKQQQKEELKAQTGNIAQVTEQQATEAPGGQATV